MLLNAAADVAWRGRGAVWVSSLREICLEIIEMTLMHQTEAISVMCTEGLKMKR